jgi:hypothetical protein
MADEVSRWKPEYLPEDDLLYMRVHKNYFDQGDIAPGAFRNRPTERDGMSTDWQKYARPEETLSRARNPIENAVIQMRVGDVSQIPGQSVVHSPDLITPNRAHTDVFGDKTTEARVKFLRICELIIPLNYKSQ